MPETRNKDHDTLHNCKTDNVFDFKEQAAAPGTPSSGDVRVYADADGYMRAIDDAGNNNPLSPKRSVELFFQDPSATEEELLHRTPIAITVIRIYGETDTGTVTFKIKWRAEGSLFSGGTEVESTSLVADDTGEEQTSGFEDPTIPAGSALVLVTSATSGTPTKFVGGVDFVPH